MKWILCVSCLVIEMGCNGGSPVATSSSGTVSTTAAANSSSATSGGATSGGTISGGIGSSAGTTGGSTSGGATSGGTTGSPFFDGGYVFCELPDAADAGPNGDGGPASWMCRPGTYICDLGGDIGNCFQCTSDVDCQNQELPTYDPQRPRCDLASGVPGYQNLCQQCVANADCAGNPVGDLCNLNPTYPPTSSAFPLEIRGFESCGRLLTDCRLDGGPVCNGVDQACDPGTGVCVARSGACATDQDCVGFVVTAMAYNPVQFFTVFPEPYCVAGACNSCPDGGVCGPSACYSDLDCGDAGLTCDTDVGQCGCKGSTSCGGIWPSCEGVDGGQVDDDGQAIGFCGCDRDDQCGVGLVCLHPAANTEPSLGPSGLSGGFCGIPCTSPLAAPCESLPLSTPICNPATGLCDPCATDQQCKNAPGVKGPRCDYPTGAGDCGCIYDFDCPAGEVCATSGFFGACEIPSPTCTPTTCDGYFCNWDSGVCVSALASVSEPSCLSDYDCSHDPTAGTPFCGAHGMCVACRDDADCVASGRAAMGAPSCGSAGECSDGCTTDADCANSPPSQRTCSMVDAGTQLLSFCACGSDADCAGEANGTHCDLNPADLFSYSGIFGTCTCQTRSDCPNGECIENSCSTQCASDSDCGAGNFCDGYACRPRCDPGHECQSDAPVCDVDNLAGNNDGGVIWCYQCLQATDCDAGEACQIGRSYSCGKCYGSEDCRPNEVCLSSIYSPYRGVCEPTCDAGPCPPGEVCDTEGVADYGLFGPYVCYQCLTPLDCPNGEGCNSQTHTCGTCTGPNAANLSEPGPLLAYDCPPGSICSNYWDVPGPPRCPGCADSIGSGVCLANCDAQSCPADQPICAVLPALDPTDSYCFGCLQDSDCASFGPGAWCDISVGLTFSCQTPAR